VPVEDRTIDTDGLRRAVSGGSGWLQLADGLLDRLDPIGIHVVLPAGRISHDGDDLVLTELVLDTGDHDKPTRVRVPMPLKEFLSLPTAYDTIVRFQAVIAGAGDIVERWLAGDDDEGEGLDDDA
jgi:hypothetical protein